MTAPLASVAARLPPVPTMLNGVSRVSPDATCTRGSGTPSSSATSWASVVSCPCPWGCWLVNTVTVPSGSSRIRACCTVRGAAVPAIAAATLGGRGAGST